MRWLLGLFLPSLAYAVPGPDTVVVIGNRSVSESVALAERYREARAVPRAQVCLVDLPSTDTIPLEVFQKQLVEPVIGCLGQLLPRIEAAVLMRGMPLRIQIGEQRASLAAALGLWRSNDSSGQPILGQAPGASANCGGTPCIGARWPNPYRQGTFDPGWEGRAGGNTYRPLLVTMLHGRSYSDAAQLIASATTSEALSATQGTFLFMDGADPARGALDGTYVGAINALRERGLMAERVSFDSNLTGQNLAAFFTGTAALGQTIEGNTFLPGSLVDNLTSFGAVPPNFEAPEQEQQVSIARWVVKGVAGVHGTTDEPLNNCFPSRALIVDWADGWTLAESYHRQLPFVYWHNLVLGDAMAAAHARRPVVSALGASENEVIAGSRVLTFEATDLEGRLVESIKVYRNGELIAQEAGPFVQACFQVPEGEQEFLVVAQLLDRRTPRTRSRAKGWHRLRLQGAAGSTDCSQVDAGVDDAGVDDTGTKDTGVEDARQSDAAQATEKVAEEGCGCTSHGLGVGLMPMVALRKKKRRRAPPER